MYETRDALPFVDATQFWNLIANRGGLYGHKHALFHCTAFPLIPSPEGEVGTQDDTTYLRACLNLSPTALQDSASASAAPTPAPIPVVSKSTPECDSRTNPWFIDVDTLLKPNPTEWWLSSGDDKQGTDARVEVIDLIFILDSVSNAQFLDVQSSYWRVFNKLLTKSSKGAKFKRLSLSALNSVVRFCPSFFCVGKERSIEYPPILCGKLHNYPFRSPSLPRSTHRIPLLLAPLITGLMISTTRSIGPCASKIGIKLPRNLEESKMASSGQLKAILDTTPNGIYRNREKHEALLALLKPVEMDQSLGPSVPDYSAEGTHPLPTYTASEPPPSHVVCFVEGILYTWIPLRRYAHTSDKGQTNFIFPQELRACVEFLLFAEGFINNHMDHLENVFIMIQSVVPSGSVEGMITCLLSWYHDQRLNSLLTDPSESALVTGVAMTMMRFYELTRNKDSEPRGNIHPKSVAAVNSVIFGSSGCTFGNNLMYVEGLAQDVDILSSLSRQASEG